MRRRNGLSDRACTQRAAMEPMELIPSEKKAWEYVVRTQHGVYAVDSRSQTCTCGDFRNRILKMRQRGNAAAHCKHLLRVLNGTRMLQATLLVESSERRKRSEWKEAV